ncbi:hypothetical protein [Pantoea sp. AS142]|uniref:hypothetical protein n=1 Tax=Pantoea sp. AS142 TaxID=3081292 RepID=UPI003FA7AF9B
MRERPIIFNADMVRAVLDGRKTQTRRIMRVQPESNQFGLRRIIASAKRSDTGKYHWTESNATGNHIRSAPFSFPFGAIGDRLWVREAFRVHSRATDVATLVYKASEQQSWTQQTYRVPIEKCNKPAVVDNWTPSIHMPRWASRITLKITGVRVERLQDISAEDAAAEGIEGRAKMHDFGVLWSSIYGDDNWQANPWVWVIEFKPVEVE